jgi:hypothetical protein
MTRFPLYDKHDFVILFIINITSILYTMFIYVAFQAIKMHMFTKRKKIWNKIQTRRLMYVKKMMCNWIILISNNRHQEMNIRVWLQLTSPQGMNVFVMITNDDYSWTYLHNLHLLFGIQISNHRWNSLPCLYTALSYRCMLHFLHYTHPYLLNYNRKDKWHK